LYGLDIAPRDAFENQTWILDLVLAVRNEKGG